VFSDADSLQMSRMCKFELLVAIQACMIYLIMCVIDNSPENEDIGLELLLALNVSFNLCAVCM
jgi:hypothetical protein